MSNISMNITDTRIAAVYKSRERLLRAKTIVMRKLGLTEKNLQVIAPSVNDVGARLEDKASKVKSEMWTLHVIFGAIGLTLGMVLGFFLANYGPLWAQQNPTFTYIALVSPSLFIGLFIGGFLSLKPQRDTVNQEAVKGNEDNNWTLVIDTEDTSISRSEVLEEVEQTEVSSISK